MIRFNVNYFVGKTLRHGIIEAQSLEDAEQKSNELFTSWVDVQFADLANATPAYQESEARDG